MNGQKILQERLHKRLVNLLEVQGLKPAELTPITAVNLGKIMMEAGLPPGYLNIVFGPGNTVGEWLLADPRFALYRFTGSPPAGRRLRGDTGFGGFAPRTSV